jgi:hypothetical protein
MNSHFAVSTADWITKSHQKRYVLQAKSGKAKLVGIAVGAQHGSVTKGHATLDAAFVPIIAPRQDISGAIFHAN